MIKLLLLAATCCAALVCGPAHALPQSDASVQAESALRQDLQQALWPADIVRIAGDYLSRYPDSPSARSIASMRDQARDAMRVLSRNDVRLYRSAFNPTQDSATLIDELRRAALGDREAAVRLAHLHQRGGDNDTEASRYVGWLQFAAVLGNESASYELAVHYRRLNQPVLAAKYEARAVELGYVPPNSLDHNRK